MADSNIVVFGLSNVHIGTYEVAADGTVTMGTPEAVNGAVNLTLESDAEENTFHADNIKYWTNYTDNGFTGSLEMARFPDAVKTAFFGYETLDDGGLAKIKGVQNPKVYIMFQSEGDAQHRRAIMYNVAMGPIQREYATIEDTIEPATETVDLTVTGDNATGIVMAEYNEDATGYATLFTAPPAPTLPSA